MRLFLGASVGNCALLSLLALQGHRCSYSQGRRGGRGGLQVRQDSSVACHMCSAVSVSVV